MDKSIKILIGLIAASLLLNYYSFSRIGDLKSQISDLNRNIYTNINNISQDVSRLSSKLNEMKEADKWIKDIDYIPNQDLSTPQELHLAIQWSFNEIEAGAKAFLLYKSTDEEKWIEVTPENNGLGAYRAPIQLTPDKKYHYKIVAKGNAIKTGELTTIPTNFYRPTPLVIQSMGEGRSGNGVLNHFHATLVQHGPPIFNFFKIKEARAYIYDGSNVIRTIELNSAKPGVDNMFEFEIYNEKKESITSIVIEVKYEDGTVEKGEIYPEDQFSKRAKFQ